MVYAKLDGVVKSVGDPDQKQDDGNAFLVVRSEERRVGKECRIGCRSRWSPYH